MAFDFPSSPTNGQKYTSGAMTYAYNGYGWQVEGGDMPSLRDTVITLTDAAPVALDASLGNVFKLLAAGNRTISVPTNKPAAGVAQRVVIMHEASGADRTLALTTGSAGAFRFGTEVTELTVTTSGLVDYIGCIYNAADDRWDVVSYSKGY